MEDLGLGKLIETERQRDAVHVAVAPVVSTEKLWPGQDVGFVHGSTEKVSASGKHIGIIDPFLKRPVMPEQRCWMFLYPQTITSLRHDWTHPAFTDQTVDNSRSRLWLQDFADRCDLTYEGLLEVANSYLDHGEYLCDGGKYEGEYVPDEFWDHFQVVTGRVAENKGSFFSCSC